MRRAHWRCKVCQAWGTGGPAAWLKHHQAEHAERSASVGSSVTLGFVGRQPWPGHRRVDIGRTPVMGDER